MSELDIAALAPHIVAVAREAGAAIEKVYQRRDEILIKQKDDKSPVTEADLLAHQVICEGLAKLTPELPVLSEEAADIDFSTRQSWKEYWLVDPLDGTKEFIHGNGEFTVNIALIADGEPVLGVVGVPITGDVYYAAAGHGAWLEKAGTKERQQLHCRNYDAGARVVVVASRRHGGGKLNDFLLQLDDYQVTNSGSSLKFCRVAEGVADIYPRFAPTSEWDTAAAHCVLRAAGGEVVDLQGQPLRYNSKESLLNPQFLAVADINADWLTKCS